MVDPSSLIANIPVSKAHFAMRVVLLMSSLAQAGWTAYPSTSRFFSYTILYPELHSTTRTFGTLIFVVILNDDLEQVFRDWEWKSSLLLKYLSNRNANFYRVTIHRVFILDTTKKEFLNFFYNAQKINFNFR